MLTLAAVGLFWLYMLVGPHFHLRASINHRRKLIEEERNDY